MAQRLSPQQKAGIVWECWFRDLMDNAAMCTESITQIICAYYGSEKEFVFEGDYDGNGIIYWVGTHYGEKEWANPAQRGLIKVDSSGWNYGSVEDMVGNKACRAASAGKEGGSWASIEFVDDVMVKPTQYTLTHNSLFDGLYLRNWVFEGSSDGEQWTLIKQHHNDQALNGAGQSHTWSTPNVDAYFNRFRVRMTGKGSGGDWCLTAHALEIYGFVAGMR